MRAPGLGIVLCLFQACHSVAATLYVDVNSPGPAAPYSSWATAATAIQDAVDAASPGDLILVTNGIYQTGGRAVSPYQLPNRVAVTIPVTIQSVNGPGATSIAGSQVFNSVVRCVFLTDGASLAGFTLTNGGTLSVGSATNDRIGAGVWCFSTNAVVSNCVMASNMAYYAGAGAYGGTLYNCGLTKNITGNSGLGGGACSNILNNCTLTANQANDGGGAYGSVLNNCTIVSNLGYGYLSSPNGGGTYNCTLNNCTLANNTTMGSGGGAYGGTLNNCVLTGNLAARQRSDYPPSYGGGAFSATLIGCTIASNVCAGPGGATASCTLDRCVVYGNFGSNFFGFLEYSVVSGGTVMDSLIFNNTVVPYLSYLTNSAPVIGATVYNSTIVSNTISPYWFNPTQTAGGALNCNLYNSIIWSNLIFLPQVTGGTANYSCAPHLPNGGIGNLTSNPLFVDFANSNFHLQPGSPCVNSGNNAYSMDATDLDGRPRIAAGTVDMGAYELAFHYVNASNTTPLAPYTNWATAATNIGDATAIATYGDMVLVTNGVYRYGGFTNDEGDGNERFYAEGITVASVNGPTVTTIVGNPATDSTAMRCATLAGGSSLIGFTLINGGTSTNWDVLSGPVPTPALGGGVVCLFGNSVVSNCIFIGNSAFAGGAAAADTSGFLYGPPFYPPAVLTLYNCQLLGNTGYWGAGGASVCTLSNCVVASNSTVYAVNYPDWLGGGGASNCTLYSCIVSNNSAGGGGNGGGVSLSTLYNCLVVGNTSSTVGGGASKSTLVNCTVSVNSAVNTSGGCYRCTLENSIVFYNSAPSSANYVFTSNAIYTCATPLLPGIGNFTNDPHIYFSGASQIFRLQSNSPCINSGNNSYVLGATDLDGNPRISGGTVDMGAYEFQNPASIISYAWLQQYGLPTDGSADFVDTDHNGMNNWQKWVAGLNPTNPASVLQVMNPAASGTNIVVTWQSVTNISYFLQRSPDLSPGSFQPLATNIPGQSGTTSYTDTNAPAPGPWFYRVGVP